MNKCKKTSKNWKKIQRMQIIIVFMRASESVDFFVLLSVYFAVYSATDFISGSVCILNQVVRLIFYAVMSEMLLYIVAHIIASNRSHRQLEVKAFALFRQSR